MTKYFTYVDLAILRSKLIGEFERAVVAFKANPDKNNYRELQDAMLNHQDAQKNAKREYFEGTVDKTGRFYFIGEPPISSA